MIQDLIEEDKLKRNEDTAEALEEGLANFRSGPKGRYSTIGEKVNRDFDEPYAYYYGLLGDDCEASAGDVENPKYRSQAFERGKDYTTRYQIIVTIEGGENGKHASGQEDSNG